MSDPTISEMIETILAQTHQTQYDFAARIGTTPARVSEWRTGKRQPQAKYAGAIRARYHEAMVAGLRDDVQANYAAEGKARVLKRLEMAEAQGLSPHELLILGDALWRFDDGESQAEFLLDRLAITPDREKLEAVIDRLVAGGWWPWQ
jgi:transcriptional regulator with XRE-family HTH domain